jgi:hypothetical protein
MLCYLYIHLVLLDPYSSFILAKNAPYFLAYIVKLCDPYISVPDPSHQCMRCILLPRSAVARSVVAIRETGLSASVAAAAAAGDRHEIVDAVADEGEDEEEKADDDSDDVVFLHFEGLKRAGGWESEERRGACAVERCGVTENVRLRGFQGG